MYLTEITVITITTAGRFLLVGRAKETPLLDQLGNLRRTVKGRPQIYGETNECIRKSALNAALERAFKCCESEILSDGIKRNGSDGINGHRSNVLDIYLTRIEHVRLLRLDVMRDIYVFKTFFIIFLKIYVVANYP